MHGLLPLISDIVLMGLLVTVIIFAVRLDRRLSVLRDSRTDLENLVRSLLETTARAETGLRDLKTISGTTLASLKEQIDKAQTLRDEVQFMVESGNQTADRLLDAVSKSRATGKQPPKAEAGESEERNSLSADFSDPASGGKKTVSVEHFPTGVKSKAEKDLMQAMESLHPAAAAKPASK